MLVTKWKHQYTVASVKVGLIAGPHVRLSGDGPDADGSLVAWSLCTPVVTDLKEGNMQILKTGDKVRPLREFDLSTSATRKIVPAGTPGVVIEDLNEVVAKENQRPEIYGPPSHRHKDLALVRFEGHDAQGWLRYADIELIEAAEEGST